MTVKLKINNPLQEYIDEMNSLDILKEYRRKHLYVVSEETEVDKKVINLKARIKRKEDLILLMKELKNQ